MTNSVVSPLRGYDRHKIFLSNLHGQINSHDLHSFFIAFGHIEHIESWTNKSAIILFSDIHSVDRVLAKHRRCTINQQEIFIRRIRYGHIDRVYQDSSVLFIKPVVPNGSIQWTKGKIRESFKEYDASIDKIRLSSYENCAWIYFNDYDPLDRLLLQSNHFQVDGIAIDLQRAPTNHRSTIKTNDRSVIEQLREKNRRLKQELRRQDENNQDEIRSLCKRISRLKRELDRVTIRSK